MFTPESIEPHVQYKHNCLNLIVFIIIIYNVINSNTSWIVELSSGPMHPLSNQEFCMETSGHIAPLLRSALFFDSKQVTKASEIYTCEELIITFDSYI